MDEEKPSVGTGFSEGCTFPLMSTATGGGARRKVGSDSVCCPGDGISVLFAWTKATARTPTENAAKRICGFGLIAPGFATKPVIVG